VIKQKGRSMLNKSDDKVLNRIKDILLETGRQPIFQKALEEGLNV
jgi:hypothetical protein